MKPTANCATCDGYALIPGDAQMLVRCPDCVPVVCPVHREKLRRRSGVLFDLCHGCLVEAEQATANVQGSALGRQREQRALVA